MENVALISIRRVRGGSVEGARWFSLSIHARGTGISWFREFSIPYEVEERLGGVTHWASTSFVGGVVGRASQLRAVGNELFQRFFGNEGKAFLANMGPAAYLLEIDETLTSLPWELLADDEGHLAQRCPLGRLVSTALLPRPSRNPQVEDKMVRVLLVANPTRDLRHVRLEIDAITRLQEADVLPGGRVEVKVLEEGEATRARFRELVAPGEFDVIHFSGHGSFDLEVAGRSALLFSDGPMLADEIERLEWKSPPYFVFGNACNSASSAQRRRLRESGSGPNGLAAAFIVAGVQAYAGFFWPVEDEASACFASTFYRTLFARGNHGLAFLEARRAIEREFGPWGDTAPHCAVFYGDVAGSHGLAVSEEVEVDETTFTRLVKELERADMREDGSRAPTDEG